MAEGDGLLNRYRAKSPIGGSNPPLSAILPVGDQPGQPATKRDFGQCLHGDFQFQFLDSPGQMRTPIGQPGQFPLRQMPHDGFLATAKTAF